MVSQSTLIIASGAVQVQVGRPVKLLTTVDRIVQRAWLLDRCISTAHVQLQAIV